MPDKRQSFVEKKLEFLINVDNFESLRVGTTFGETIEWSSSEERQKKLDALTKSLAKEVAKDAKEVLIAYGLKRKSSSQYNNKKTKLDDLDDVVGEDDKVNDTEELVDDKVNDTEELVDDKVNDTEELVDDKVNDTEELVDDEVNDTEELVDDEDFEL